MKWRFIELSTTDPAFNLAVEEYVFDRLSRDYAYFMLWQNRPSVIIGRHQNTAAEVNEAFIRENGISVIRRLSGGGAVYHDLGNLNFTFIRDGESSRLDLSLFCEPVAAALRELGVPAEVNGRNDITVEGQKISGNAQYVREGRVMHHGTLLFSADLEAAGKALTPSSKKLKSKGVASVRSRIATVSKYLAEGVTIEDFKKLLLEKLFVGQPMEAYELTEEDLTVIEGLRQDRYATRQWNYGESPPCDLVYEGRIEGCGSVELRLTVKKGLISKAELHGDFFAEKDITPLEAAFVGLPPERESVVNALSSADPTAYIPGLTREALGVLLSEEEE